MFLHHLMSKLSKKCKKNKTKKTRVLGNATTGKKPNIFFFCENRQLTLTFSIAKSFLTANFKFWVCMLKICSFTAPKLCINRSKTMTVIDDKVDSFFRGSPRIIIEQVTAVAFLKRESLGKKGCQYSHIRSCFIWNWMLFCWWFNRKF